MDNSSPKSVFHSFSTTTSLQPFVLLGLVVAVVAGLFLGYLLATKSFVSMSKNSVAAGTVTNIQKGAVYGSDDTTTFKDSTDGVVAKGGIQDEGQFHLVRPGGDSQNVYMTSSLVDLSLFVGRHVKVWGQTQKAKVAGWLMDVGRVEVLD